MVSAGPYTDHLHLTPDKDVSTSPLIFLQAECPSCHPTNSVKALTLWKEDEADTRLLLYTYRYGHGQHNK